MDLHAFQLTEEKAFCVEILCVPRMVSTLFRPIWKLRPFQKEAHSRKHNGVRILSQKDRILRSLISPSSVPEDKRDEKYKVKGCQSQVWLYPEFKDGKVFFHGDSDAVLVKGIVGLLVSVYSDATPDEILATKPDFLKEVGITEHLSMNRSN